MVNDFMSKCSEWIEDILGAVKQSRNTETIQMIECCGKGCADRKNAKRELYR